MEQLETTTNGTIENTLLTGDIFKLNLYELKEANLYKYKKEDGKFTKYEVSPAIFVEKRFQNFEDDFMYMELKFWVQDRFIRKELPMADLTNLLPVISQYGMPLTKPNLLAVQDFLVQQQKESPLIKIYTTVGFFPIKEDGRIVFGLSKVIGDTAESLQWFKEKSSFNVDTKGSVEAWLEMVKTQIIGTPALEFMIGVGCSAIISGYLNRKGQDKDSLVINLVGTSSTGKTTASKLAISMFGSPIKAAKNGLFHTFNATENAIIKKLVGNYGVPILIDEFSMSSILDTTRIAYGFADGKDKARVNDQNGLHEVGTWATTLILNGENSIVEQSNKNLGIEVRLLEFKNVSLTSSAEQAEAIAKTIHDNYGLAGLAFVEYVSTNWSMIDEKLTEWTEKLRVSLPESSVKARLSQKYAIILAALELASEAFNLTFSLQEVEDFIIANERQLIVQRDIADVIYSKVINDIRENYMQFTIDNVPQTRGYTCRGKITTPRQSQNNYYRANYLKSAFDELINNLGLSNKDTLMKELKKKPYFNHEQDRPTTRTNIEGIGKIATYEFHIPKEELDTWIV